MLLATTTAKIEFVLGEAIATNQIPGYAAWFDGPTTPGSGSANSAGANSNGVTQVTLVASPLSGFVRQINEVTICNTDTINHTVAVRFNDGTNTFILQKAALTPGQSLIYSKQFGWGVVPAYSAGQIPGTATNDNAAAGNVGEYISASLAIGGALTITSNTPIDILSISLTPGDWDVWGIGAVSTGGSGTAAITVIRNWISTVSATDPSAPNNGAYYQENSPQVANGTYFLSQPIGLMRISLAATTPVYLSASHIFTSTPAPSVFGFIGARRVR